MNAMPVGHQTLCQGGNIRLAPSALWQHAFMNPKDMPFAVFMLISITLGFRMVDVWNEGSPPPGKIFTASIIPAILLGLTTAIRFIGPYAVLLIGLYFISDKSTKQTGIGANLHGTLILVNS